MSATTAPHTRLPLRARVESLVGRAIGRLPGALARALSFEPALVLDGLTLDPHVQGIRASRNRLHPLGLCEPTVEAGRQRYTRDALALHPRPTPVAEVRAVRVAGAAGALDARLYVPTAPSDALLVYFHGGGFVLGDLDTHDEPCRQLCAWAGTRVLGVAYRLAPEHPFPAGLDDALAAFRWARTRAASLGADPARVSVGGDSAGGHLATMVARTFAATPDRPRAQLLIYPVTQLAPRTRSHALFGDARLFLEARDMVAFRRLLTEGVAVAEDDPRLSPLLADTFDDQPPALVVTAGFDPLRDEGRAYVERLRAAGSRVEALEFGSLVHGFLHMTTVSPGARAAMRRIAEVWRGFALLLAVCLVVACGGAPDRATTTRVATAEGPAGEAVRPVSRDTVIEGDTVTLHVHEASAFDAAPQWTLEPVPAYVAGDAADGDGRFDVDWVQDAQLLRDGRLVTLQSVRENVLLVFDARGRGQHRWGRTGGGPGDLMRPMALWPAGGDTLLVPDDANARLNVVRPDLGIVSSRPVPQFREAPVTALLGVATDGALLVTAPDYDALRRAVPTAADSITRPAVLVRALALDGSTRELARIPGGEQVMRETRYRGVSRLVPTGLVFGRAAYAALVSDQFVTSAEDAYALDWRDADGRLRARVQVAVPQRPVTAAIRERAVAAALERLDRANTERMVDPAESRRLARAMPFADSLGWFHAWRATGDGVLWVVDPIAPTDTGWTASAWNPDGLLLARLHAAGAGAPLHFTRTHVVVRTTDEDGVAALEMRRIVRAAP